MFNKKKGVHGKFTCRDNTATFIFVDLSALDIDYGSRIHLPIALAVNAATIVLQMNLFITTESNQNLTLAQHLLLQWHFIFGHNNCNAVRKILRSLPFAGEKYASATRYSHI